MPPSWPNNAKAAITLTFDNMGEAADLNRNLWPASSPIGSHYSVTRILPQFLSLAAKYSLHVTYFCEAWNLGVYPDAIRRIHDAGHEVAWHAWQHEAWGKECKDEGDERANFERSFEAMRGFCADGGRGEGVRMYEGFRPPGGTIHGERTLRMCREYGLGYISPAAERGALVPLPAAGHPGDGSGEEKAGDSIVVLPFRWRTVDAYYYMPAFSALREMKGELPSAAQPPSVLVEAFKRQIDEAIAQGGFVSFLFHPFLTDSEERMEAMEEVLAYLAMRRDEGEVWVAPCREVEAYVRQNPGILGNDPGWDNSSWR